MLIEVARQRGNYLPDLSFGTHFFQDLVEASIRYLPLYPDDPKRCSTNCSFDVPQCACRNCFRNSRTLPIRYESSMCQRTGRMILRVLMNADLDQAVASLSPPNNESGGGIGCRDRIAGEEHWRWRFRMAQRIAAQLDPKLFGVKAFYLIGSTKNATAGPQVTSTCCCTSRVQKTRRGSCCCGWKAGAVV